MNDVLHTTIYRDTHKNIKKHNPFRCHKEAKEINPRATENEEGVALTPPLRSPHKSGERVPINADTTLTRGGQGVPGGQHSLASELVNPFYGTLKASTMLKTAQARRSQA